MNLFKQNKKGKSKKKQKANKGVVVVSLIIVIQIFLLFTGYNPMSHKKKAPNNQQVDRNVQANLASPKGGYVDLQNFDNSDYGSYARIIPPLSMDLRPYYQIATIVNVQPKHIYQQFAVTPIAPNIPPRIQKEMDSTHLPIMTREFYVGGTTKRTISQKNGERFMFDSFKYNKLYNEANETEHFWGKPYVLPPMAHTSPRATVKFAHGNLTSNGYVYNRIDPNEAMSLMAESSNGNTKLMGY